MAHGQPFLKKYQAMWTSAALHAGVLFSLSLWAVSADGIPAATLRVAWQDAEGELISSRLENVVIEFDEAAPQGEAVVDVSPAAAMEVEPAETTTAVTEEYVSRSETTLPTLIADLRAWQAVASASELERDLSRGADGGPATVGSGESDGAAGRRGNFGHRIQGNKIVWVLDTSDSMERRMDPNLQRTLDEIKRMDIADQAKHQLSQKALERKGGSAIDNAATRFQYMIEEMRANIHSLEAGQEFAVIFFNDQAYALEGRLQRATIQNKVRAVQWMEGFKANGSTNPLKAIKIALRWNPDAIYFLTDGKFADETVVRVAQANRRQVPIHTIGLGDSSGQGVLMAMARHNGGNFEFVQYAGDE